MKHLRIFDKNTKAIISRHNAWDDSWGIDKWPSFNSANQIYIITDPIADINEAGLYIQPSNYSSQNPGYTYVDKSNLDRVSLSGLALTSGDGIIDLAWNANSGCTYKVYRDGVLVASPSSNSFNDTGLTNGQSYFYEVFPMNGYGTFGYSQNQTAVPNV